MTNFNKALTTGEIASYCGISRMGVLRWIKEGKLEAYRTPGGHFRVTPSNFNLFLNATKFPPPDNSNISHTKSILIITQDSANLGNTVRLLSAMSVHIEIDIAMDEPSAIAKTSIFQPNLVIFDGGGNNYSILDFVIRLKRILTKGHALPTLLLTETTLVSSEISLLAEIFSPIILEPTLPNQLTDSTSERFKTIIQRVVLS